MPRVSATIPTYQVMAYLQKTSESLLRQIFPVVNQLLTRCRLHTGTLSTHRQGLSTISFLLEIHSFRFCDRPGAVAQT